MDCQKCLEENKRSIEENGYGYGYIGKSYDCQRHNPQKQNNAAALKWTDGQPYERSRRLKHVQEMENKEFSAKMNTDAYTSALNHDENTWDVLNQGIYGGFKVSNKREELDSKMTSRDMVQQIGFNPFLGETNYVNDIAIRDQFLKPINTTQGSNRVSNNDNNF
jgi:hypothetical protein